MQSEKGNVVRRLTITERPGYEPDGYGFARRVEDKLFGMALAINKREQERKIMAMPVQNLCPCCGSVDSIVATPPLGEFECRKCLYRPQERKSMASEEDIPDGSPVAFDWQAAQSFSGGELNAAKANLTAHCEKEKVRHAANKAVVDWVQTAENASWASPETLTAQLRRLRFEIQTTQTRLAEADKLIEKVLAGL